MKSLLAHDWLLSPIGGGENVLKEIHQLFPSPICTLVSNPNNLLGSYFQNLDIRTSFIQKLPFAQTKYRNYLPLFPSAMKQFGTEGFDLILSSSHCVAKSIRTTKDQLHICYCHTPVRYAWDLMESYLKEARLDQGLKRLLAKKILEYIRYQDVRSSTQVDYFVANSNYVAKRIQKFYNRSSEVIYPPVNTDLYQVKEKKEDYYVTASRVVLNKKIDLIVDSFRYMPDKKLIVIGDGPERKKIEATASSNVTFVGFQTDQQMKELLQKGKAFLFAALEDFGIVPVEAMACGTPVIAFGEGGVLETVIDGKTGLFFKEQTVSSLIDAIKKFEHLSFDPRECRKRAELFSQEKFREQFLHFVLHKYTNFKNRFALC